MNRSKKLVFSFFISASLMSINPLMYDNVHATGITPNTHSSAYTSEGNIFAKCGYTGQCTWFTYGRVLEKLGISLPSEFYGNAIDWWYANARDGIYSYGTEPRANSIAVWSGGSKGYGHVGFVEQVDGNTVYLNEGNFNIRGAYDGSVKTLSKAQMQNRGNIFLKGYIYVGSGSSSSPHTSTQIVQTTVKSGIVNVSSSSSLNIRSGANTSFGVIGSLRSGQSVQIVGTVGNWYKIKLNSTYGYVNADYIKSGNALSSSIGQGSGDGSTVSLKVGYVKLNDASSVLNLRNSPNGSIIGALSNSTKLNIIGTSGSWYKVSVNGKTGYVSSSYVTTSQSNTTLSNSSSSKKLGRVILKNPSSSLNLRLSPWTGRVIASLSNGTNVTILGTSGLWYKVSVGTTSGYVHSDYIKLQN
ncbi:SH3 domain-containing protein [Clostridium sp. LBM24168]